jgi:predicted RNA-binding Zn ribbon-like protein
LGGEDIDVPQPGGRPPAPGQLRLVQAFINTHYDLVAEHGAVLLATPEALGRWLAGQGLIDTDARLSRSDLRRALALREGLRALAASNAGQSAPAEALAGLNDATAGATLEIELGVPGARFTPAARAPFERAAARLLAIVAEAMVAGTWARLKACPGDDCGWAFYDGSRNSTGRWCSMSVCGGRAKAKAHYRRQRGQQ